MGKTRVLKWHAKNICMSFVLVIFFTTLSYAAHVTLKWDPNPEPDIKGYKVYYKIDSSGPPYDGAGALQGRSPITVLLADLADPNDPEFTLSGLNDSTTYYLAVTVYNDDTESDFSDEVTFTSQSPPEEIPPSITRQPTSQTVTDGQSATFSVTVSGTAPLSYQWTKGGNDIPGATSASYTTPPATLADDGSAFQCIVSNPYGEITSSAAQLTVNTSSPPPPTSDIILTAGFENGKTSWHFYTSGQGSFEVAAPAYSGTSAAKVTTVTSANNIQLYQYDIPLEPDTDYRLTFNAYSNSGHDMRVSVSKHVSPYTNYGLSRERIALTTKWQTYTVNFRTENFSAAVDDARLSFWFATDAAPGDVFWIDNVVLHVFL